MNGSLSFSQNEAIALQQNAQMSVQNEITAGDGNAVFEGEWKE